MPSVFQRAKSHVNNLRFSTEQYLRRAVHKSYGNELKNYQKNIVNGLKKDGVYITHLDELAQFGVPGSQTLLSDAKPLMNILPEDGQVSSRQISKTATSRSYVYQTPYDTIIAHQKPLLWGLNEQLLQIVEEYIGLPILCRGLISRCDLGNTPQSATRFWHLDGEDSRIVKIIVYLNGLEIDGGPFTYVTKSHVMNSAPQMFDGNRITDETMNDLVESRYQCAATGRAGTVVFADPCSIWHRGSPNIKKNRYTLFFAYNSQFPRQPGACGMMFEASDLLPSTPLMALQKNAITPLY